MIERDPSSSPLGRRKDQEPESASAAASIPPWEMIAALVLGYLMLLVLVIVPSALSAGSRFMTELPPFPLDPSLSIFSAVLLWLSQLMKAVALPLYLFGAVVLAAALMVLQPVLVLFRHRTWRTYIWLVVMLLVLPVFWPHMIEFLATMLDSVYSIMVPSQSPDVDDNSDSVALGMSTVLLGLIPIAGFFITVFLVVLRIISKSGRRRVS